LGASEACLGRLDAALAEFKRAIDARFRTYFPYAYLAASEAVKGNDAEAKLALAEARRLNPQFTIKWYKENFPGQTLPIFVDGWRKAGLPEESVLFQAASSSSNAFDSFKSSVSKPSVNQP
jgi:hypothetical protein